MSKMIDVLEQSLVQNFSLSLTESSEQFMVQLHQGILNASEIDLHQAIRQFCSQINADEDAVQALELNRDMQELLANADNLKNEEFLADVTKIVALCLAYETNTLSELDIYQPLQDYPV